MDRKSFLKNSLLGVFGLAAGTARGNSTSPQGQRQSTYDKLMKQVGFNHLPNHEISTMKTVLHKAQTRGHANHGWLDTHHSFSFANYYNPERMHFGVLRVLNDDRVAPGRGFGRHPHDNMEIISIPLEGDLEHKDSMGNVAVIRQGDLQVMSAGTGIFHSEYNRNPDQEVKFLQIWLFPDKKNVQPRYDQIRLPEDRMNNRLCQILSPSPEDEGVWIHQQAWFFMGNLTKGFKETYDLHRQENGVYAFVISGNVVIEGQQLGPRDGFGVWDTAAIRISADSDARLLLMEVPMQLS